VYDICIPNDPTTPVLDSHFGPYTKQGGVAKQVSRGCDRDLSLVVYAAA